MSSFFNRGSAGPSLSTMYNRYTTTPTTSGAAAAPVSTATAAAPVAPEVKPAPALSDAFAASGSLPTTNTDNSIAGMPAGYAPQVAPGTGGQVALGALGDSATGSERGGVVDAQGQTTGLSETWRDTKEAVGDLAGYVKDKLDDPMGNVAAADAAAAGQDAALDAQKGLAEQLLARSDAGQQRIWDASQSASGALWNANDSAEQRIEAGFQGGKSSVEAGNQAAKDALYQGYAGSRDDLLNGYGGAGRELMQVQELKRHEGDATTALNATDAYGQSMLSQPGGMYAGFEQDPGYQFRKQQGEEAIMRQASAQGGRGGGATMKALADYNSGLASQEFGNFANRQQAAAGLQSGYLQNQAGRQDNAALTAQQNKMSLTGRGFDAQSEKARMLTDQGRGLAGTSQQYGTGMADQQNLTAGRLSDIYGTRAAQGADQANLYGSSEANLATSTANNMANIGIGAASQNQSALGSAYSKWGDQQGAPEQARANDMQTAASIFASIYGGSDAQLKSNITRHDSAYGAIGLRGASWEWNAKAKAIGLTGKTSGVIAQEVAELYPEAVKTINGYLHVNYGLLNKLVGEAA